MKKIILAFAFIIASLPAFAEDAAVITSDNVKKMIDDKAAFGLVDSRREKDFWEEHIETAVNLPASDTNAQTLAEMFPDVSTKLVFYCQNVKCQASHIASSKAIGAGYQYVYVYTKGIEEWKELGYPTVKMESDKAVKVESETTVKIDTK